MVQEFQSRLLHLSISGSTVNQSAGFFGSNVTAFRIRSPREPRRIANMENHVVLVIGLGKDAVEPG
jgi:hypothetical protein